MDGVVIQRTVDQRPMTKCRVGAEWMRLASAVPMTLKAPGETGQPGSPHARRLGLAFLLLLLLLSLPALQARAASPLSWSEPQLITPPPYTTVKAARSASCPTTTFCAVGDEQGNVLTSTNPTGGSSAWTATHIDADNAIRAIACPSASLCVIGDDAGNLLTSTSPTAGAAAWSRVPFTPNERITAVACPLGFTLRR